MVSKTLRTMASSTSTPVQQSANFPTYLSTINVSNFVSSKLCGDKRTNNYSSWREQMLCLIESQDLLSFINGKRSSEEDNVIRRTDRLVKGWILGSVDDAVLKTLINCATATDVWLELEKTFSVYPSDQEQAVGQECVEYNDRLYKAMVKCDWTKAEEILRQHSDAIDARFHSTSKTLLHISLGFRGSEAIEFFKKLVDFMPVDSLELTDKLGNTALHVAAETGNIEAVKILVGRQHSLLHKPNKAGDFPVHLAALRAHRSALRYLIVETKDEDVLVLPSPYLGENGVKLLCNVIDADLFDVALNLVEKYPDLAIMKLEDGNSALKRVALKRTAFLRLIRPTVYSPPLSALCILLLEKTSERKNLRRRAKQAHEQAMRLVKCLCKNMESLVYCKASVIYEDAILTAARLGIHEIVEVIVATFPEAIYTQDIYTKQSIFHVAAENRHLKIFDLINETRNLEHQISNVTDVSGNTVLHYAARLASPQKLNDVIGAAAQMQKELVWFKEIEKYLQPQLRDAANDAGKTAWMVFTEEHAAMKAEGEKWVKDTANACTIIAALIATVTFAAAITVPGGLKTESNDGTGRGFPLFSNKPSFKSFTWLNIISFFTSITSLFIFLSTITSRYAEQDFMRSVPTRLRLNILFLFASVCCMMGAFMEALYLLIINDGHINIIESTHVGLTVVCLYAAFPIYLFLNEQIPLIMTGVGRKY